jgi:hypothetical protein
MGRIVRELGEGVTKYYWYPGQKSDWIKTAIAVGAGGLVFLLAYVVSKNSLVAAVLGSSVATGVGGAYLGRRDVGALQEFHDMAAERRAAMLDGGRAAWRGTVQGFACAAAAVFVINMPHTGFVADWLLPVVPAIVGAIAHTIGMIYERMSQLAKDSTQASQLAQAESDGAKQLEPAG